MFGLKTGQVGKAGFDARIRELTQGEEELESYIFPMLEVRRGLVEQCKRLEKLIIGYVREDRVCRQLMSIPGVGALTALSFKITIDKLAVQHILQGALDFIKMTC